MNKLKYIILCCVIGIFATACTNSPKVSMSNPWIECEQNLECAKNKAGFDFPVELSKYNIRAMEDMIEVEYPFNDKNVIIRKSTKSDKADISGDYNKYATERELSINYIPFNVRGDNDWDKIYVVYFSSKNSSYAIMCDKGLNLDEIWDIYEIIKKADRIEFEN